MHTIQDAIAMLHAIGLVAEIVQGDDDYILGGTECSNDGGVNVYVNSFLISKGADSWDVTVIGPGQLDTQAQTLTLEEAIAAVQRILSSLR